MTEAAWPFLPLRAVLRRGSEVIDLDPIKEYREISVRLWGKGVVLRGIVTGAAVAASRRQVARQGQLILSRIDARNGALGIVPESLDGAIVSNDFPVFDCAVDRLLPKYLDWLSHTRTFVDGCRQASEGTTNRVRLQEEKFLAIEIPLPPIPEQQRLVSRIDELAARIHEARVLRAEAKFEAEALFGSNVSRLFLDTAREQRWPNGVLGDYVLDAFYGTSQKTTGDDSGTPILRMGNIQKGRLDLSSLAYLHLSGRDRQRLLLRPGDILVNRTNSAELVGKCAVFEVADGDYSFASYLIRLRLDRDRAEPRLVAAFINSPLGRAYMLQEKRQMTGQANVNATKLKALPIALPPLSDQRRILADLDALQAQLDSLTALQADTATELDALLPSILDRAFRGEL